MAAVLSANAEKDPKKAWSLNMKSLFNVLDLAKKGMINKIFWPSSIAVFGPSTPKVNVPQVTVMEPTTIYGISKLAGERLCQYYRNNYNIDIRSLRFPGIIGWQSKPGGGTTDYAVEVFHKAVRDETYHCFLNSNTMLPMMFMEDAIRATIEIMSAELNCLSISSSYNLAGLSFTPKQIFDMIKSYYPSFKVVYEPDYRQSIADSWPDSIDDSVAQFDFKWKSKFDLQMLCEKMIENLKK
jgi:nucleoside-diphosphate-sugar epimerase